jgi:3-phenylpropionate/trans-cinnamate dioxygenase ferredoxin reductase subunit
LSPGSAAGDSREELDTGSTILVVGASLAGLRAAEALRERGFRGRLVVVDAEPVAPYDRPPLSKEYLAGTWGRERIALLEPQRVDALGLDLRLGWAAKALDLSRRSVLFEHGAELGFDRLVVATGASPRVWRDPVPDGVLTLRTLADADTLRRLLRPPGRRLVVVGGGFLGLEVAATACRLGAEATVVEPLPSLLGRVLPPAVGAAVRELHERHGVRVLTGVAVAAFEGGDRLAGVRLERPRAGGSGAAATGDEERRLGADVALVAIGVRPSVSWLESSGLPLADGLVCDAALEAAPGVVAAGDVARFPHPLASAPVRLEHWTNAAEQGRHVAATLLLGDARAEPFSSVPYFWSDQFEVKIQAIGLPEPSDEVVVVDGSLESGRFVALCARGGSLVAAIGFGRPRQLMAFHPLLRRRATISEAVSLLER